MKESITGKEFLVPSDLSLVQKSSADVLSFLGPLKLNDSVVFDLRLCLEEALINAMKYGHKLQKELKVRVGVEYNDREIRIRVEDQGEGFDPRRLANCTEGAHRMREHGRGVHLIHQLMDEVRYNPKGNAILMVKRFGGETEKKSQHSEGG